MINGLVIDKLLTIDDTGMPKAPTLRHKIKMFYYYGKEILQRININI